MQACKIKKLAFKLIRGSRSKMIELGLPERLLIFTVLNGTIIFSKITKTVHAL